MSARRWSRSMHRLASSGAGPGRKNLHRIPSCRPPARSLNSLAARGCRDPQQIRQLLVAPGLRTGNQHGRSNGGLVMRSLDLSPLFRSTVGFDHLDKLFETAFREAGRDVSYPPYNIAKLGQDKYRISMAVAGFGEGDLDITAQGGVLTVKGQISDARKGCGVSASRHRPALASSIASSWRTTSRWLAPTCAMACSTSSWRARCRRP